MQIIPTAPNLNARMRKFRFIVLNNGPEGQMSMREQPQIGIAPNPQYLINLYAASGDKIRILEELPPDGETASYGKMDVSKMLDAENTTGWAAKGNLGAGKMMTTTASEDTGSFKLRVTIRCIYLNRIILKLTEGESEGTTNEPVLRKGPRPHDAYVLVARYIQRAVPWPLSREHPHTGNQDRAQVWRMGAQCQGTKE